MDRNRYILLFNRSSNQGFDVVIGNPPYNEMRDLSNDLQKLYKNSPFFEYAQGGRINIFQFFYPFGVCISKNKGVVNYIVQNSLLGEDSALNNRRFIFDNTKILHIDSFPERDNIKLRVFEPVKMSVCVCFLEKQQCDDYEFIVSTWKDKYMSQKKDLCLTKAKIKEIYPEDLTIPLCSEQDFNLLLKIKSKASQITLSASAGEIDMTKYKPYFTTNQSFSRVITGAQIHKYYINNTPQQGGINYIQQKYVKLSSIRQKVFENERIVMQRITGVDSKIRIIATIVPAFYYCANSTNYLVDNTLPLYFVLGILNCNIINYYFKQTSTNTNVTSKEISKFPIPTATAAQQQPIIDLVDEILTKKKQNPSEDTTDLEGEIDKLVYELYGLTDDEIKVVEGK